MDYDSYRALEVSNELTTDLNVIEAFAAYFLLGLHPGSFGQCVLENELNKAYRHAHPLLYKHGNDVVPDHIKFCELMLPEECWGNRQKFEAWMGHQGLKYAPPAIKIKLMLQYGRDIWPMKIARYEMASDHIWSCERETS